MSIARAIMKDAPIIILDEETANVDQENEKELMEAVAELTHDKTVIRSISARSPPPASRSHEGRHRAPSSKSQHHKGNNVDK